MKKHRECNSRTRLLVKLLRIMKLTSFLILAFVIGVSASSTYSQTTKLNLRVQKGTFVDVLKQIEKQSEFYFYYNNDEINRYQDVSIDARNMNIEEILGKLLQGTDLDYQIIDRYIAIKKKDGSSPEPIEMQQGKSVAGKVSDSSGQPLPGVSVVVKGTTNGTISDANGNYSLSNIPENAIVQFSFVGMKTQEVAVSGKTTINVTLDEDAIGIEEVVAIGYGTVKKRDLTGAVGSIDGGMVSNRKSTQLSQALQGSISGLMVTRTNNAPGASANIRIRGITTIGDNNPLVIVDGVPVDDINMVNPNDVESISVLKDAASASIYGSRAAAGVILITTKRAKVDDLSLEYTMEYGFEKPTVTPDYVDAVRYMQISNESGWNDVGNQGNEYPVYAKDLVDNYNNLNKQNPNLYPITDWSDLILNSSAPRQSQLVSLTGGSKFIRSKASLGYDKTDGLYDGIDYNRYTSRFTNDITINKFIGASLDLNFNYSISERPFVSERDIMYFSRMSGPIYAAMWSDGRVASGKNGDNIYGSYKYGGSRDSKNSLFSAKASIDIKPFDGLKLSAIFSPQFSNTKQKNFRTRVPYYSAEDPTVLNGYVSHFNTTYLEENRNDNYRLTTQFLANYTKDFGNNSVNLLAGFEDYYAFNENMGASRDQYTLTSFPYLNIGPLEFRDNSGNAWENAYQSWFGRVMYDYKNRYFVQANIRYDASSRFHSNHRWGAFPSISAGWVISEEDFMKNIPALQYLKLRSSWGTLGNERIGNYPYQSTIEFNNVLFSTGSTVISALTAAQRQYVIESISWETTESFNWGFDTHLLNSKLRISGDYFKKTTKDMLLALEIPDFIGFDNPDQNTGKMKTTGWEIEAGWNDNIRDFTYSTSINLSDFKSVMGDLGGTEFLGDQIKIEGSEFNEWYGYVSEGLFQTAEEVASSPLYRANTKPGDVKYKDISGPEGVPDGIISPEYDRVLLGGSLPRFMYGANLKAGYKNFDFSIVLQGIGKQNARMSSLMVQPLLELWGNIPSNIDGNYWSVYNSDDQNLNAKFPRISNAGNGNNFIMSDFWMFNGRYLRLKNISFGYNIPESMLQNIGLRSARVYASLSDIYTWSKYPKGWDPEVSLTGYPITASVVFGVSVKF